MRLLFEGIFTTFCVLLLNGGLHLDVHGSAAAQHDPTSFYQLLKLNQGASETDVKRAYRRLSLELHPDKVKARQGDTEAAERLFQEISRAYEVLSNNKSRRLFDVYGPLFETQQSYYEKLENRSQRELYLYRRGVHLVHGGNLDPLLRGSPYSWVVSFYQAGCGSCESKVPFFSRLGELSLETPNVRVAMVNCSLSNLCHFFGISHLGQILLLPPQQEGGDSWDHQTYEGPMRAESILKEAGSLKTLKLDEASSDTHILQQLRKVPRTSLIEGISAAWIVDYYRPSCPPCRQLRTELKRMMRTLSEKIRVTLVNCDIGECDVPHYPFLRLFVKRANGSITSHSLPYGGGGHPGASAVQLVAFIFNNVLGLQPPDPQKTEGVKGDRGNDEL